jgi:hypothetical protein
MTRFITLVRPALAAAVWVGATAGGWAACPPNDPKCLEELRKGSDQEKFHKAIERAPLEPGPAAEGPAHAPHYGRAPPHADFERAAPAENRGNAVERTLQDAIAVEAPAPGKTPAPAGADRAAVEGALTPVREYLRANQIPPPGAGAYGIVVFQSKATPANRDKLVMVCHSFVAFFPRGKDSNVPVVDQMITIWPIDDPTSSRVIADDCDYVIDHYDLTAAESAVRDAHRQQPQATFEGDGPYLIGWSPSNTRGVPDKLVLVIDMSADNSQASIDHKFLFWKDQIVEDPQKWRSGFSLDRVRTAIHDFADQYGQAMLDAIKLVDGK